MRRLIFLLCLVSFFSLAFALDFKAEFDRNIIVNEFIEPINVKVNIYNATPGLYNFYTLSDFSIEPGDIFRIEKAGEYYTEFKVIPRKRLYDFKGDYYFTYALNHRDYKEVEKGFIITFLSVSDIFSVYSSLDYDNSQIRIVIKNDQNLSLRDLKFKFSSIFFSDFSKVISFGPYEEKEIVVDVDRKALSKTRAGSYILDVAIETPRGNRQISSKVDFDERKDIVTFKESKGYFVKTDKISSVNKGNTLENVQFSMRKDVFSRLFTSFSVTPNLIKRDGLFVEYVWIYERLGPGETFSVTSKTNYLIPIFLFIFIIVFFVGFRRYTSTIVEVKKSALPVRTKSGEFALKVKLSIKAKKRVENLSIIDKVPAIVKLYNKFDTIRPDKIDIDNRRIHWNVGDLDQGEERFVSYIVYSKVGVIGKICLPEALVVFERAGKVHEIESKKVYFMNEVSKD